MKRKTLFNVLAALGLALLLVGLVLAVRQAQAQEAGPGEPVVALAPVGTGFTYQGRLVKDGRPVSATCSFQFTLYDAATGGSSVAGLVTVPGVPVSDGYFTAQVDFGAGAFAGDARWLGVAVNCPGDGSFVALSGRVELTAAPYAFYALSSGALQGRAVLTTAPAANQVLKWNGSAWAPASNNQPPVAILQADPAVLYLGLEPTGTTMLNMSASYDPEEGGLTYAFDPLGRTLGLPASYGGVATYTAVYTSAGNYLAAGWVRDSGGAYARAQAQVAVYRFEGTIADRNGTCPSMTTVANRPAMAYFASNQLRYVRADNATGLSWGITHTLDNVLASSASLAVVQNNPAISYYDSAGQALRYTRANDELGGSWTAIATLDNVLFTVQDVVLAVVNGNPAVAYWDFNGKTLRYIRAADSIGSSWSVTVTVANMADNRFSMAVVNGHPAIAYCTAGGLMYIRANDADGSSWPGLPRTVDESAVCSAFPSLTVVGGRPAIAYKLSGVRYIRANDADGNSWPASSLVVSSDSNITKVSMRMVNDRPTVAYILLWGVSSHGPVRYVQANDASGATWGTPATLHNPVGEDFSLSLVEVEGRPAIAYADNGLVFAIPRQ